MKIMKKELFIVSYNQEMDMVEMREVNYVENFGWCRNEYLVKLFNTLAISIGVKIRNQFKSEKVRKAMLELIFRLMEDACFETTWEEK